MSYAYTTVEDYTMEYDRFRSFAERYVVARASTFVVGREREDAWQATLDAKTIYRQIAEAAKTAEPVSDFMGQYTAGAAQGKAANLLLESNTPGTIMHPQGPLSPHPHGPPMPSNFTKKLLVRKGNP